MQPDCSVSHRKHRMQTILAIQFLKKLTTEQCKEFQWKLMFQLGCFYQVGAPCTSCNFDRGAISTERRKKTWSTFKCFTISKRASFCRSITRSCKIKKSHSSWRQKNQRLVQLLKNCTTEFYSCSSICPCCRLLADLLPLSTYPHDKR
jgi:hypothetical protein